MHALAEESARAECRGEHLRDAGPTSWDYLVPTPGIPRLVGLYWGPLGILGNPMEPAAGQLLRNAV